MAPPKQPILLVEDDPELRASMSRILRSEGHEVLEAGDVDAALALGRAHHPGLLVVDDVLPGVDGVRLLSSLREAMHENSPPAVLLRGGATAPTRAFELGAKVSLRKPFQVEDLLRAVDAHRRASGPDA